jgi:hypothetical protein
LLLRTEHEPKEKSEEAGCLVLDQGQVHLACGAGFLQCSAFVDRPFPPQVDAVAVTTTFFVLAGQ